MHHAPTVVHDAAVERALYFVAVILSRGCGAPVETKIVHLSTQTVHAPHCCSGTVGHTCTKINANTHARTACSATDVYTDLSSPVYGSYGVYSSCAILFTKSEGRGMVGLATEYDVVWLGSTYRPFPSKGVKHSCSSGHQLCALL